MKPYLLIADADAEKCDTHKHFLAGFGYEIATSSDGLDCLAKLKQIRPIALVLDLALPWGGGDGILAWLREEQSLQGVPVILTGTDDFAAAPADFMAPPVASHLTKPFTAPHLLDAVRNALCADQNKRDNLRLRILIVDDDIPAAQSLAMLLQVTGQDVRTVYDGPSALDAAREYRPNLILLDIGLPKMNGFDVAKLMRAEPELNGVPIVAVTGRNQEVDRQHARESGFDHFLLKPADFNDIKQILAVQRTAP